MAKQMMVHFTRGDLTGECVDCSALHALLPSADFAN